MWVPHILAIYCDFTMHCMSCPAQHLIKAYLIPGLLHKSARPFTLGASDLALSKVLTQGDWTFQFRGPARPAVGLKAGGGSGCPDNLQLWVPRQLVGQAKKTGWTFKHRPPFS